MFFKGNCFASDFPKIVRDCILTNDPNTGAPFWQMVSSNVGTSTSDDGYVFQSTGTNGSRNIIIGIKSEVNGFYVAPTSLSGGFTVFVSNNYTPGTPGTNGKFGNEYFVDGTSFIYNNNFNRFIFNTLQLSYYVSVKKDRVIIAYTNNIVDTNNNRTNVIYMGAPTWVKDFSADGNILGMTSSQSLTSNGYVRMTNSYVLNPSTANQEKVPILTNDPRPSGWGSYLYPQPIYIRGNNGGIRAKLDVYLLNNNYPNSVLRHGDSLIFNGIEYHVHGLSYQFSPVNLYNNLININHANFMMLIPKD